jgi:flagellar basal body rod protein FlgG
MEAQGDRLAVLANNLANVTTAGFKADRLEFFQPLFSPHAAGPVTSAGPAAPFPAAVTRTRTEWSAGPMRQTGNPLDLAFDGAGFFVVSTSAGPRLTRAGAFTRGTDGLLTAADGAPVLARNMQTMRLPESETVTVDATGMVRAGTTTVGQLLIVAPRDPSGLVKDGSTRFAPPEGLSLDPASDPQVVQGALEQSNVNPVLTLVEMIDALRVYEAAQRAAKSLDETLGRAVNDVGRL